MVRKSLRESLDHLPVLLTTNEVAEVLRVHRRTIDYMAAHGKLTRVKVGGSTRFYRDDVLDLIDQGYQK